MPATPRSRRITDHSDTWTLQDAKARLSEVPRRARSEGPQYVTVHGREEAVILTPDEFRRLQGEGRTGQDLIDVLQSCPAAELDLALEAVRSGARDVDL